MSGEEVVLKMITNRLEKLLEENEPLRTWSAELMELVQLGKGVIVEAPEPGPFARSFGHTGDGRYWVVFQDDEELYALRDVFGVAPATYAGQRIYDRAQDAVIELLEPEETYNDDPDDDPIMNTVEAAQEAPTYGIDLAAPVTGGMGHTGRPRAVRAPDGTIAIEWIER